MHCCKVTDHDSILAYTHMFNRLCADHFVGINYIPQILSSPTLCIKYRTSQNVTCSHTCVGGRKPYHVRTNTAETLS